jgi:hypothetical protein
MRFYLDTEFIERGHEHPIELISIGLVAENGAEYYAVAADGWHREHAGPWVREHVLPFVEQPDVPRKTRREIADNIRAFTGGDVAKWGGDKPEFWGYFADYDWVVFCQLFGAMVDLPKGWPLFCRDVIQLCKDKGNPQLPKQTNDAHHALADARHIREMHNFLLALP